ncbi:major facilitator superfamily domain-containing protein [Microdochium trichocladiopsis]|uniref:Major facilitator superfamily domain-containing protein n=1 Tax=Microdochium trichocladiopsis TaxID=1682393 RepID=A0A9P8XYH0_9PEZI|nr:major facilitator superfamily domain-containing protein [Microdochium trichocladiopsis]KAH7020873.1 major facilitator superfamily domain-containing protein [Microdochium trichocladiopsis]
MPVQPTNSTAQTHTIRSEKSQDNDSFLVSFADAQDPSNPLNWSSGRKWAVTDVLSATGFNRIMVSTIMAPALPLIAQELHMSSTEAVMSMSIYLLATAFGPLFIGPLSEMYGRAPVLHASNVWFLVWNIACGFATTKELLIGARFLAGFGASSIYALAGGVLGDVWRPEQRGQSLALYLLIPLLAVAVGPIIGGFMAYRTTWRWMFWATSVFQAVMVAMSFICFRETYAPAILQRRAERLRKTTGDSRYQTVFERLETNKSLSTRLSRALSRPLRLLAFHPIIQVTSIMSAFNYGLLYILLSSLSEIWTAQYGQSVEMSGLHYVAVAAGEIIGSLIGGKLLDMLYPIMKARFSPRRPAAADAEMQHHHNDTAGANDDEDEHTPELRIPLMLPGLALAPLGFFLYGWTAQYHTHWSAVDAGVLLASFGMQLSGIPRQAYVMDAYPEHTSSALAASQFLQSLTAFLFPLFVPQMYASLGYGWGNSLLGFLGLFVGCPMVWALWMFGARLRSKATMSY